MGFFLDGKQNYILFHFYINGKLYKYSTKLKIQKSEWDLKNQRPKKRRGKIGEPNRKITEELNQYESYFNDLQNKYRKSLTKEKVRQEFDLHFHLAQVVKTLTYSDYFHIYIEQKKESQSIKKDSWQKYTRIHTAILEMQKINKTTYYLHSFDKAFFNSFIAYLRGKKEISDNTLRRKLGFFKSFLNWCLSSGYTTNVAFKGITVKPRETFHVSLSDKELETLAKLELEEPLAYYRDLFLIGCYSGQRYSDYKRINKKYVEGNSIVIRAKKTGQFSYIPLTPKLKNILDKYDWQLRFISSQKFNKNIQKICKIAGFEEIIQVDKFYGNKKISEDIPKYKLIGSHTARRTFITLSSQKGVPPALIMQSTGIKSFKTLSNYIKVDKDKLNEEMFKAWM